MEEQNLQLVFSVLVDKGYEPVVTIDTFKNEPNHPVRLFGEALAILSPLFYREAGMEMSSFTINLFGGGSENSEFNSLTINIFTEESQDKVRMGNFWKDSVLKNPYIPKIRKMMKIRIQL